MSETGMLLTIFHQKRYAIQAKRRYKAKPVMRIPITNLILSSVKKDLVFTDRKSTRLNSGHANISYAVFCLKKRPAGGVRLHIPAPWRRLPPGQRAGRGRAGREAGVRGAGCVGPSVLLLLFFLLGPPPAPPPHPPPPRDPGLQA